LHCHMGFFFLMSSCMAFLFLCRVIKWLFALLCIKTLFCIEV
jgi:hypothetical protein